MNTPGDVSSHPRSLRPVLAALSIVGLVALTYANSLHGIFVYDDVPAIPQNPTIRELGRAWHPPPGLTVSGRPLLNLTLALNHAISGLNVWSYHVFNIAIHALAAAALFGIVRRTLLTSRLAGRFGRDSTALAWVVAVCWALHPLQTESVDYIIQRTESMMGLCYLGSLYCFIRMFDRPGSGYWKVASVVFCALGMGSKEVMVSAPLVILWYDKVFCSGMLRNAWRARRGYYIALMSTWAVLMVSLASTGGNRNGTKGFDIGVSWSAYALTQVRAVARYLHLALWPDHLAFNYAPFWVSHVGEIAWPGLLLLALLGATLLAVARVPAVGFCCAWFFVLLAPASLVPGTGQMIVEHRMYLSLAAVVVLGVCALYRVAGRSGLPAFIIAALLLALRTHQRNADYRSELALWGSSVAEAPADPISQCNFGIALAQAGRAAEAIAHYRTALELAPQYADAHYNLAIALARRGQTSDAIEQYKAAIRSREPFASAHANLALLYAQVGRTTEAIAECRQALAQVDDADVHGHLANILYQSGQSEEAMAEYRRALALQPRSAEIHYNFGTTLLREGRIAPAIEEYRAALRHGADDADTHYNLALAYEASGESAQAIAEIEHALRIQPDYPGAADQLRKWKQPRN